MTISKVDQLRQAALDSFSVFARLVGPNRSYGLCHEEAMFFLTKPDMKNDQLLLYPRAHLKSHLIAIWVAWWITKHPDTTVLYVSATEDLAISQLYAIKSVLESDVYRRFWPEMIHEEEAKRAEWSARNIKIDHPMRKQLGVRDRTVAARSIGSNTTGLHADVIVFDDIVVPDNAYTEEGRKKVAASYSQFSSVANPNAITKIVGTRYHGKDIYESLIEMTSEQFDAEGNVVGEERVFEVLSRQVEEDGEFLWPREVNPRTGKSYGFDNIQLAKIRAKYFNMNERAQYYAQYYNNPNSPDDNRLGAEQFQYYDRKHLQFNNGVWTYNGKPLNITAAGDLAYTTSERSDYTAFAVVGKTSDGFAYILDLVQFKTSKYQVYYDELIALWRKWGFKKCRIETNAGAGLVVQYIKDELRKEGAYLSLEGKESRKEKIERSAAILEPLYASGSVFHYRGGHMSEYEEQIILSRPAHDDLKDAVSAAPEINVAPSQRMGDLTGRGSNIVTHQRFGGRIR